VLTIELPGDPASTGSRACSPKNLAREVNADKPVEIRDIEGDNFVSRALLAESAALLCNILRPTNDAHASSIPYVL
jgi:hypothetical protein